MGTCRVITSHDLARIRPAPSLREHRVPDDYKTRLIKYIPADVVAVWVFLDGILRADPSTSAAFQWTVFGVVLALTPLWTWYRADEPDLPPAFHQIVTSTVAFAVWALALGGPFERLAWYTPSLASVLLALFTLVAPLVPFLAERCGRGVRRR